MKKDRNKDKTTALLARIASVASTVRSFVVVRESMTWRRLANWLFDPR